MKWLTDRLSSTVEGRRAQMIINELDAVGVAVKYDVELGM